MRGGEGGKVEEVTYQSTGDTAKPTEHNHQRFSISISARGIRSRAESPVMTPG